MIVCTRSFMHEILKKQKDQIQEGIWKNILVNDYKLVA